MKILLSGLVLAVTTMAGVPAELDDYAGRWKLDAGRSHNLPAHYAQVKRHDLEVEAAEGELRVRVTIQSVDPEPLRVDFLYRMDGKEVEARSPIRTPRGVVQVPTTLRAQLDAAGSVRIDIVRTITTPSGTVRAAGSELWSLSPDGTTLTVHRRDETPQGLQEYDMVFVRG